MNLFTLHNCCVWRGFECESLFYSRVFSTEHNYKYKSQNKPNNFQKYYIIWKQQYFEFVQLEVKKKGCKNE